MNSISSISFNFTYPWLLLLLIPAVGLALWPYFRLPAKRRRTRNRIVSLILHLMIVTLCVGLLSGMTVHAERVSIKSDVILLVDASDSNEASNTQVNEFIQSVIEESKGDYNIGIITFGKDTVYAGRLGRDSARVYNDYVKSAAPDGSGTDIANALTYARDQLSDPKSGRIILMSDGLETDGNAVAAASAIAKAGTRIDVVFFPFSQSGNEVQINSVVVPLYVNVNQTVQINVHVQSARPGTATLSMYDNGQIMSSCSQKMISLSGGTDMITVDYAFTTPLLHEIKVEINSANDTRVQNNTYYAFVNIEVFTKILIVDGTGSEAAHLNGLLSAEYNVDVVGIAGIPNSLSVLRTYDEVILMNVANADLPAGFDAVLHAYVRDYGGGLFTVGGDKAYNQDDMAGSLFESMLPVDATTAARPLALMIIIDASGSMREDAGGGTGKTRIEVALEGAIASVNALKDTDQVGVISFNSAAREVVPLSPATQRESIIQDILTITTATGTRYRDSIDLASRALNASDLANRHIIFITDGGAQDTGYMEIIQALGDITLSTIGIGNTNEINHNELERMAVIGGGRYYYLQNASTLDDIMLAETFVAEGSYHNANPFTPTIRNHTQAVNGIMQLPELGGYYGTTEKAGATVVLAKGADPVYAEWQFGLGRVGSFTSDLNGTWSSGYFTDEQGKLLIMNIIRSLLPTESTKTYDIDTVIDDQNHSRTLRINTKLNSGDTLSATVTAPDGSTFRVNLTLQSANLCYGVYTVEQAGIYKIYIVKKDSSGNILSEVTVYNAFSYSAEYNGFPNETECYEYLKTICDNGNGTVLFSADGMFGAKAETVVKNFDPRVLFLILAIVFFLLDIAARKFKLKRNAPEAKMPVYKS